MISALRERRACLAACSTCRRSAAGMRSLNCWSALLIRVIPGTEHGFAPVEVAADAVKIDYTAPADLDGGNGGGLNPTTHNVRGDQLCAEHVDQNLLRAKRRVTEIGNALRIPLDVEPHYTRLFHGFCPILVQSIDPDT